jgi:sulfur carrier protein ThiS
MTGPGDPPQPVQNTATLLLRRQEFTVQAGITVRAAIEGCGLEPAGFIVTRAGELIADEDVLRPGDRVKLLPVPSGG